jgi:outer membrane receptor protein involved in Fe transport
VQDTPFAITTSNELLDPQHGTNLEAGIYHETALSSSLRGELSMSVYHMDMEDELDFNIETLRYINIGKSRHRGLEAGLALRGPRASTAFLNYTQQDATTRVGENSGNRLKAIPRHVLSGGLSAALLGPLEAGFLVSHARAIFLDDANTLKLPAYSRVDARVSYPVVGMRLFLDVRNVFDSKYSTTAFPDPSGSGAIYYHPAAGRTLDLGLRGGF